MRTSVGSCSAPQRHTYQDPKSQHGGALKKEDARAAAHPNEGFDVTRIQCTKMACALDEATKNDSAYVPSKLLDFIVGSTFESDGKTLLMGCTMEEKCDWLVYSLKKRMETGQYWVCFKVFSVLHELLWRGSNDFVRSMRDRGMDMLNYSVVLARVQATKQENVSGTALPCTLNNCEALVAHQKVQPVMAAPAPPKKKQCGAFFNCSKIKAAAALAAQSTVSTPAPAPCDDGCPGVVHIDDSSSAACVNGQCGPRLVRPCPSLTGETSNSGLVDLYQQQQEFMTMLLAYLDSLCRYRYSHPTVDLPRSRIGRAAGGAALTIKEHKALLDDTLELLKCVASSDPHVPVACILVMSVVRKRMNDVRVLYNVACLVLLDMLQYIFAQAKHCMEIWRLKYVLKVGGSMNGIHSGSDDASSVSHMSFSVTPGSPTEPHIEDTEHVLRNKMIALFAQWYHATFQFDRTVQMLQQYCEALERSSGETYLVASHLHRIPKESLESNRELLKKAKAKAADVGVSDGLSDCDLTTPINNTSHVGSPSSDSDGAQSPQLPMPACPASHLEEVRRNWSLQVAAMRQLFEMEGEAPRSLTRLQGALEEFINVKATLMSAQDRQSSTLTNGLSSSTFPPSSVLSPTGLPQGQASAREGPCKDEQIRSPLIHKSARQLSQPKQPKQLQLQDPSGHTDSDSLSDLRGTGTFILRRKQQQQQVSLTTDDSLDGYQRSSRDEDDLEVIPLTEEMQETDESIQSLLRADDVVVVCNEPSSCTASMKLAERFQIISGLPPLGEGTYGRVYRAWDELVGCYLAAKEMPLDERKKRASAVRELMREYMVLTELDHPNIVRVAAFMVIGKMGRIFMEWVPSGSLHDVLQFAPHGALRESVVSRYAHDALQGLAYLHDRGVLHRDVKPGNMLLGVDGTVKLTDFGTSSVLSAGKHTLESAAITGTAPYMAPEAVQGFYSAASEVWSLGCSVVELVSGKVPWTDPVTSVRMDAVPLLFKIGSLSDTDTATVDERPSNVLVAESAVEEGAGPEKDLTAVSDDLMDFLKQIFTVDRRRRPTAQDLLQHPFIAKNQASWELCKKSMKH